ncbi:thiol reductase thioredoxin [Phenylobacterium hankyongense]|uniref:Thiol reductase thioredoxin n=1 Tax=Phenylobacterium hankyongense TaxID=1813876 RepID=A0A328AYW5_9CAUL|nr:thioredoxin family protein [Phenylobacterium hankyongense]RAK58866.1 thiol reductase thioredoxin [Phenylobacterium hankyongense]
MTRSAVALAAVLALTGAGAASAAPAPKMGISDFAQLQTPLPYPYDEQADADAVVAKAKARAKAAHKLLIVDLGGNWCPDCRVLAATMARPELKAFIDRHYEVVMVDVGRFDRNLQIPARYGITRRLEGVPALLVIDPRADKLLDAGHVAALADARSMTPQALADWLAQWVR